jgi:hypothetical protein
MSADPSRAGVMATIGDVKVRRAGEMRLQEEVERGHQQDDSDGQANGAADDHPQHLIELG